MCVCERCVCVGSNLHNSNAKKIAATAAVFGLKKKGSAKKNGNSFANFLPRNEKFKFFRARSLCQCVCVCM